MERKKANKWSTYQQKKKKKKRKEKGRLKKKDKMRKKRNQGDEIEKCIGVGKQE